ncbi:MAG TPA: aspartate dehydrogenase [Lachnospiraceae bacterium]|jgi:hypothetical protein|nr:aspartate dehydrogenase [Lachnospiraceae bacterium]
MSFFHKKEKRPDFPYDPEKYQPVIKASICFGEKVAGFRERSTGEIHEIMAVKTPDDMQLFLKEFGLSEADVKTIY